ncbi:MAG TPA: o-succinylbenzoate synthase, partial [Acidimicrobiia bacterium]|nr:o-succinylbenzoate synthase [Acidimicrobiia bacterium]
MKIESVDLVRVAMPLVLPFRTSFGTQTARDALLVRVKGPDADGWGECVAMNEPLYSAEYVDGAQDVIERFLLPRLMGAADVSAERVAGDLADVKGHPMAKAAVEMAILDAELCARGESLAAYLGAVAESV